MSDSKPWDQAEREMREAGIKLDDLDLERGPGDQRPFMWLDALILFWHGHHRLPTSLELQVEMFEEWDDPCSRDEAEEILEAIKP
jgi:hypothetical protein